MILKPLVLLSCNLINHGNGAFVLSSKIYIILIFIYIYFGSNWLFIEYNTFGEGDPLLPLIGVLFVGKNRGGRSLERYRRIFFGSKIWAWEGIEPAEVDKCPRNSPWANH